MKWKRQQREEKKNEPTLKSKFWNIIFCKDPNKKSEEEEEVNPYDPLSDKDLLKVNSGLLDHFNDNFTNCFLGVYFYMYPYLESDDLYNYTGYIAYICVVQYFSLCFSVFFSRGDEDSWTCYIKIMPKLIYGLALFSQLVLPVIIIICSIIVMITVEDAYLLFPYLTF